MIALQASGGGTDAAGSICDDQHEFDFTLDLLLDALWLEVAPTATDTGPTTRLALRAARYPHTVTSRPASKPGPAGADAAAEAAGSEWVDSFLRTRSGKTYRLDASDDAPDKASREALAASAGALTDRVLRESPADFRDDTPTSEPPS
jgi:hypothetical protein